MLRMKIKKTKERSSNNILLPLEILIVGGILTFVAPYVFTAKTVIDRFDFTETGNIGDTIGGITSPIVGLVGAALMFWSIYLQYKANKRQDKAMLNQLHIAILQDLFRQISDSLNNVNTSSQEQSINLDRLAELADKPEPNLEVNIHAKTFLNHINYISTQFEILFKMLDSEDLRVNDFSFLNLQKEKAIRLLNLFIDTSKTRIVCGAGTYILNSDGKKEYPRNHLLNINEIIKKWSGEYSEISLLNSYLSVLSEGDIDLPSMKEEFE
jgi:hypothetical protein